jgi:hypothetical protein
MGSYLVEVGGIAIEDALELPLMQDQQVVQTFLSDAPARSVRRSHWLVGLEPAF